MINPYRNIDWSNSIQVPSCSHDHCDNDANFSNLIDGGIKYIVVSNYYPSAPAYPLNEHFSNVPDDVLGGPNAEHHSVNIAGHHFNGIGCFFASGSPSGSVPVGFDGADWKYAYKKVLETLQFADGGGITINHPHWSSIEGRKLTYNDMLDMLDFDDRVLGIEFYNVNAGETEEAIQWDFDAWGNILKTGRKCWGFCVPDHLAQYGSDFGGRTMLIVPAFTEHDCLKAYRNGQFYSKLYNTELVFNSIEFDENTHSLRVETNTADYINIVIDGEITRIEGNVATILIPSNTTYFRVEAHNDNDSIWSNAVTLKEYKKRENKVGRIFIL